MEGIRGRAIQLVMAGMIAGLVLGSSVPAFAGHAYSSYGYYTVYGIGYRNQAGVHTTSYSCWATTSVGCYPARNVPAGYMGALARLYNSSGSLVRQSSWQYNGSSLGGMSVLTSDPYSLPTGVYYSLGQSRAWNGSGYATYNTFRSPNQNYPG